MWLLFRVHQQSHHCHSALFVLVFTKYTCMHSRIYHRANPFGLLLLPLLLLLLLLVPLLVCADVRHRPEAARRRRARLGNKPAGAPARPGLARKQRCFRGFSPVHDGGRDALSVELEFSLLPIFVFVLNNTN